MSSSRRALGSVVSQGLASVQSFVLLFIALRWLSLEGLGLFTVIYTSATLVLTVTRSLVLEPLLIRYSGCSELTGAIPRAIGASALLGLGCCMAVVACALILRPLDAEVILAGAVALPTILVQDAYRFAMFADGRPWRAAVNDGVTFLLTGALVVVVALAESPSTWWVFVGWGFACGAASLVGAGQLQVVPRIRGGCRWLRENVRIGWQLAGSTAAQQASGRVSLYLVGAIAGMASLGVVAAARTLFSPLNTLLAASIAFAVPEGKKFDGRALDRFVVLLSFVLGVLVVALLVALHLLPDDVGTFIVGSNWDAAKSLLLPTALWIGGTAISQGARVGLRVLDRAQTVLTVSLIIGPLTIVGAAVGAILGGAMGAAWGFGSVSIIVQLLWWTAYKRVRLRYSSEVASTG